MIKKKTLKQQKFKRKVDYKGRNSNNYKRWTLSQWVFFCQAMKATKKDKTD